MAVGQKIPDGSCAAQMEASLQVGTGWGTVLHYKIEYPARSADIMLPIVSCGSQRQPVSRWETVSQACFGPLGIRREGSNTSNDAQLSLCVVIRCYVARNARISAF